jgi:hypothetical protein
MNRLLSPGTFFSLLFLLALQAHAQALEPADPVQVNEDDSAFEVSNLDLFDEDTENTEQGWIQFYVLGGAMYLDGDGEFAARLPNGNEVTIIDFERAGLEDTDSSHWLTLNWRSANSRWGAWFGSWRFDVTGTREWEDGLDIGGIEVPVNATVTSDFDAKWYIVEGTYSFYRSKSIDTGIGFGFHVVDLDTNITVRLRPGDEQGGFVSGRLDALAPLPNVLAYVHWKFAPRWNVVARYGYFNMDYKEYSGYMANFHSMVNYQVSPRWALGAGYQFVDLDLNIEKKNYTQIYDIQFSGPMAFARFSF